MRLFRFFLLTAALAASGTAHADPATSLYFFGDSLTDEGRNGRTAPVIWAEVLRNDLSITAGRNYAIGGASSGNQASAVFGNSGFLGQVNSFVAGAPYANAAAGVWIGTNDVQLGTIAGTPPAAIAATVAQNVRTGLTAIGGAGVANVALLGVYDLSLSNVFPDTGPAAFALRGAAASASQQLNAQLATLAVPGVATRFYDIAAFINQLQVNARAYGFTQILPLQPGETCNATCQQTSIFVDNIHLTSHTQTLIGDYVASGNPTFNGAGFVYGAIANDVAAAAAAGSLAPGLAGAAAAQFAGSLLDRLDATRGLAVARDERGLPKPWTVYAYGGALGGRIGSSSPATSASDVTVGGVTAGAEYRFDQAVRVGAAFDYAHSESNLESTIGLRSRVDSYQGALYASATYPRLFLDGIVAGGTAALDQRRDGLYGALQADPHAGLLTASGRAGYLLPVGFLRVGPVGGLLYARTALKAYDETGSSFFAVGYGGTTVDSLFGQIGGELRLADPSALLIDPFLTLTYNRQFDRSAVLVGSHFVFLPTQGLAAGTYSPALDFGKLSVGSTFELGPRWYGTVTAFGIKGQEGVLAGGGNLGLAYRF